MNFLRLSVCIHIFFVKIANRGMAWTLLVTLKAGQWWGTVVSRPRHRITGQNHWRVPYYIKGKKESDTLKSILTSWTLRQGLWPLGWADMLRCKYLRYERRGEDMKIWTSGKISVIPTIILQWQIPKPDIWGTSMAAHRVYFSGINDDATG